MPKVLSLGTPEPLPFQFGVAMGLASLWSSSSVLSMRVM